MHYVYIITNTPKGILYIGTTRNLEYRISQHKAKQEKGFTQKYNCTRLVFYEEYEFATDAALREKQMKKWKRDWKIKLIEQQNPNWDDLSTDWSEEL